MALLHEAHDEHIRQLAFELWYLEAGRSPTRTSRLVQEITGEVVAPNTITNWTKRDQWHIRANTELAKLTPTMRAEMVGNVVVAGIKASRALAGLIDDVERRNRVSMPHVKLCIDAMHLAGFSPIGKRDPLAAHEASDKDRVRLVEMYFDDEEIKALLQSDVMLAGDRMTALQEAAERLEVAESTEDTETEDMDGLD